MHGEQSSQPIAAASQGQQRFALYPEQHTGAHGQDESLDQLAEYGADLGKSQQLENQMIRQMTPEIVQTHGTMQSLPQVDEQTAQPPPALGSYPARDVVDSAGIQTYEHQQ